jgi:hypothetical protein
MRSKTRLFWALAAICLGSALVTSIAHPAGAVPYTKKPIYDDTNLCPTPMSVGPHFHFSQNGDIVYQTQLWSNNLGRWTYSLYLYHQSTGRTTPIPSGTELKFDLQINDQGQVVWGEHDMTAKQDRIYLYQDGITMPISGTAYLSSQPRLNNGGQVAYKAYDGNVTKIYFFDGYVSGPLAGGNSSNYDPVINDKGQIAWLGFDANETEAHVYFFDGNSSRRVSFTGNAVKQQLNQDGWVMWEIGAGQNYIDHYALYLYTGGEPAENPIQLATNIYYLSQDPKFGASGQVIWLERQAGSGNDYLWQYLAGVTSQIGGSGTTNFDVNRQGQIAYSNNYTIYLYGNNASTQISPSPGPYGGGFVAPIINNCGHIVYFSNNSVYNSQDTVYVYNCGITKLDDPPHPWGYDRNLQLLNNGQVAWFERVTAYIAQPDEARIWLAGPVSTINPVLDLLLLN